MAALVSIRGSSCQRCLSSWFFLYICLGCEILGKKNQNTNTQIFKRIIAIHFTQSQQSKKISNRFRNNVSYLLCTTKITVYCRGVRLSDFPHMFKTLLLLLSINSMFCEHYLLKNTLKHVYSKTHLKWGERKMLLLVCNWRKKIIWPFLRNNLPNSSVTCEGQELQRSFDVRKRLFTCS